MGFARTASGLYLPPTATVGGGSRALQDNKRYERPSIPPGFQRKLESYSEKLTGLRDQLRARWCDVSGVWHIDMIGRDGEWWVIHLVQDATKATKDNLRPFRPLDDRVFAELDEGNLTAKYDRCDKRKNLAAEGEANRRAEIDAARAARQHRKNLGAAFLLDNKKLVRERRSIADRGHHHGVTHFHQVHRDAPVRSKA